MVSEVVENVSRDVSIRCEGDFWRVRGTWRFNCLTGRRSEGWSGVLVAG